MSKSESGVPATAPVVGASSAGSLTGEFAPLPTSAAVQFTELHSTQTPQPANAEGATLRGFAGTFVQVALDGWHEVIAISKR